MRNCLTAVTSSIRAAGPVAQPIFQPVAEKVLPADEIRIVRSAHARERGQRAVHGTVEDEVLVDLVGHHEDVVLDREPGDRGEVVVAEHDPGRVVRRVDQHQLGPRSERRGELGVVEPEVGAEEADADPDPAGEVDRGRVRVVEGFERDDLVARVDVRLDHRGERLGGARW